MRPPASWPAEWAGFGTELRQGAPVSAIAAAAAWRASPERVPAVAAPPQRPVAYRPEGQLPLLQLQLPLRLLSVLPLLHVSAQRIPGKTADQQSGACSVRCCSRRIYDGVSAYQHCETDASPISRYREDSTKFSSPLPYSHCVIMRRTERNQYSDSPHPEKRFGHIHSD